MALSTTCWDALELRKQPLVSEAQALTALATPTTADLARAQDIDSQYWQLYLRQLDC
jgi:hypothetical protein